MMKQSKFQCKKYQWRSCVTYLKKKGHWENFVKTIHFLIHFLSVMVLLYCGAMVFALLEDPELYSVISTEKEISSSSNNNTSNMSHTIHDVFEFWFELEEEYNVQVSNHTREKLIKEVHEFVLSGVQQRIYTPPAPKVGKKGQFNKPSETISEITSNSTGHTDRDILVFWQKIEEKYNITVEGHKYINVLQDMKQFIDTGLKQHVHTSSTIFLKWFYFVTTSVTTIGYGQVYPKTENGRLFYIFFSIFGIAMMMTLLRSCGDILSEANKKFYSFISWHFEGCSMISDELLSCITLIVLCMLYTACIVCHDSKVPLVEPRTLITELYYWTVSFTTVGFGDVVYPLELEIHHVYYLLIYRLGGLTILAAVIDALQKYVKYRKKILIDSTKKRVRKVSQLVGSRIKRDMLGSPKDLRKRSRIDEDGGDKPPWMKDAQP